MTSNNKFLSRKFIVTVMITVLTAVLPVVYAKSGVDSAITLTVISLLGGVGTAYSAINMKDAANDKKKTQGE